MLPSEEIKEKISVVDLIGETVVLKKAGVNYRGLCPFHHEKSPSFVVSPVKQIWHCFGCGLGGDIFEFIKQTEGVDFPEALEILASRAGITLRRPEGGTSYSPDKKKNLYDINNWAALYYSKILADSQAAQGARDYLQKRGLKPETIKQWQIGYAPDGYHAFEEFISKKGYTKNEAAEAGLLVKKDDGSFFDRFHDRVMFPLFDLHGRIVGFTGRILEHDPLSVSPSRGGEVKTQAKYVNSPETLIYNKSRLIYGLNFAKTEIRKKDEVIVVEGNVDVITCHEAAPEGGQAGYSNVVGSSGTAFTSMQLESLKRFTENITFALDADAAGLAALRRAVELALAADFNVKIISIPKTLAKDPDELIRKNPPTGGWEEQVKGAQSFLDFYFSGILATMDLQSNTGKKQAVRELVPLLSLLPDSIDRVHYSQKLAGAVSVSEQVILDLVNKQLGAKAKTVTNQSTPPPKLRRTKQELLEARVLGMLLKFPEDFVAEAAKLNPADFAGPLNQEIFAAIAAEIKNNRLQIENILADYPKLSSEIDLLVFALENEIALTPGWNLEFWKKTFLDQFRADAIRRRMQTVSVQIKSAEAAGNAELVQNLSHEFNHLTNELSKFYVHG